MNLHVDVLEAIWFLSNFTAAVFTVRSIYEARVDVAAARSDASKSELHEARLMTAWGEFRRECFRMVVHILLLSIVIPGLFSDRPIPLNPVIIALILVPVVLLTNTVLDARDRLRLSILMRKLVADERNS